MTQYEVFPNQIRPLGLQATAIASYSAVVITPYIMSWCRQAGVSIIVVFALSCVLVIVAMIKMPETYGIPPPEMIKEL
jgi:hypothetical protein